MKNTIKISHQELANILGAVFEANGINVTDFSLRDEAGQLVAWDHAQLEADTFDISVRCVPEKSLLEQVRERYNFLAGPPPSQLAPEEGGE